MSFYLDASFVVTALSNEARTGEAQQWLADHGDATLLVTPWLTTEIASALAIQVRTRLLPRPLQQGAIAYWRDFVRHNAVALEIRGDHFETATEYCERVDLGLRSGDALHLAVVAEHNATLVTFDQRMANAAVILGLRFEQF